MACIPYGRQYIDEDDVAAVTAVLRSDMLTGGPAVDVFEEALKKVTGAPHVVACATGTAALHLSMLALGLAAGDVVIVPAITFAATANCARYMGADVVLADVDPSTGLMTPDSLAVACANARLSFPDRRIAVIIAVHLNGQTEDVPNLAEVANSAEAHLVIDACHALGTTYAQEGVPVGASQHASCEVFSFHPVKTIAMGEGGAVTCRDPEICKKLRLFRSHGITRDATTFEHGEPGFRPDGKPNPWYYEMQVLGYNYRVSDINCALGISQLSKLSRFASHRKAIVAEYRSALAPLAPTIAPVRSTGHSDPVWHLMSVLCDFEELGSSRGTVMEMLASDGIGSQVHYIPIFYLPYWRAYCTATGQSPEITCSGALAYYQKQLSLPLHMNVTSEIVQRVANAFARIAGNERKGGK